MSKYTFLVNLLFPSTKLNIKKLRQILKGKTVLITGASSGIGEQVAYMLANTETHLILVARREDKLLAIKREIEMSGQKVDIISMDLRIEKNLDELNQFLTNLPNGIDIIVNNAGKSIRRSIFDALDRNHDFTRTMAINYFAPVQLLLTLIPMLQRNQGQIINVSTINTMLIPFPYWSAYQASKSAFDTWIQSVSPELNAAGIFTTSIYLPLVRTPMIEPTAGYRHAPAMNPEHAAKIICKSMYTKKKRYQPWWLLFGQFGSFLLRGIWERHSPKIIRKKEKLK